MIYHSDDWLTIYSGDCRDVMAAMEPESVQCVITSPPYFGLRDYGIAPTVWGGEQHEHEWITDSRKAERSASVHWQHTEGGGQAVDGSFCNRHAIAGVDADAAREFVLVSTGFCSCGAWLGVLGLEPTVELYVAHMVEVFRGVRRVLRKDGTVWLNIGDSYASNAGGYGPDGSPGITADNRIGLGTRAAVLKGAGRKPGPGLKPKDRMMVPARVALALQADGWWLRDEIVWHKPNPMPSSVTDRTTPAHEMVYLLTRSARYFCDMEAIREADSGQDHRRSVLDGEPSLAPPGQSPHTGIRTADGRNGSGRNKRSVWVIPTAPYPEAHFATFPPKLVEPMILAGTSERGCCPECGAPWERETEATFDAEGRTTNGPRSIANRAETAGFAQRLVKLTQTTGWHPTCKHTCAGEGDCEVDPHPPVPATVLDPFGGSGTTALVAERLGRKAILIELNPDYCKQAMERIAQGRRDGTGAPLDMPVEAPSGSLWSESTRAMEAGR